MARLNVEELIGGLLEAAMVSQGISERQHINAIRNYFNDDGSPICKTFKVGEKEMVIPLFILADHGSIGLSELEIEFAAKLHFGDDPKEVSNIKRDLLGLFRKKNYEHNIASIKVDHGAPCIHGGKQGSPNGMSSIKVKFKKDEKPEALSRMIDQYIAWMQDPKGVGGEPAPENTPKQIPPKDTK